MATRTNTAKWIEKQQRWKINVQKNGERKSFYSSTPGRAGQREANQKADDWLDNNIVSPNTKVEVLYKSYLEEVKSNTGADNYRNVDNRWTTWIAPKLKNKKICNVTEQDLQDILNAAHKKGKAHKTIKNIKGDLMSFCKFCRKSKATTLYPENLYIPKGAPTKEKTILQPGDLLVLFESNRTKLYGQECIEPLVNAWRFEVVTGLRPGEVIGLREKDIVNMEYAKIRRSINRSQEITKGKNENAVREFKLTKLAKHIVQEQRLLKIKLGIRSEYLFPFIDGSFIKQDTYYSRWVRYRDFNGLSKATPYELRHTFVSIIKPLPEGVVKDLVGHSVHMDTFGVYGHEVDGEKDEQAKLVQERFEKILSMK